VPLILWLCISGCEAYWSSGTGDTGDSGPLGLPTVSDITVPSEPYLGPLTLVLLALDCDETSARWTWDAQTLGWTHRATINWFHGPTLQSESHSLPSVESGAWGNWDRLSRSLQVSSDSTWQSDLETSFSCGRQGKTTQFVRIYDAADTLASCVYWGPDSDLVFDPATRWTTPIDRPDELADCIPWE
jgi:hypothetical protein